MAGVGDKLVTVDDLKTVYDTEKAHLTTINATGTTNQTGAAITAGTYFYINGVLVKALTDIASGATFTSGTNYEVVTAGALNMFGADVANGNVQSNHIYLVTVLENSINGDKINVVYNGFSVAVQRFGVSTYNGQNMFLLAFTISNTNGTLSIDNGYFKINGGSGKETANLSIYRIKIIC